MLGRCREGIAWLVGEPALATDRGERLFSILSVDAEGDRLAAFSCLGEKPQHLDGA